MNILFAWRYFRSKKTTNVINIIAWISVMAITVGTAALIVVLSTFNGFEGLIKSMYGDFYTDLQITPSEGKFIHITDQQLSAIKNNNAVIGFSTCIEEKAVLVNDDAQSTMILKGVDSNYNHLTGIKKHLRNEESFFLGNQDNPSVVLGGGIAQKLRSYVGMQQLLTIYLPDRNAQSFSNLQSAMHAYNIEQSATFIVQEDFDNKYGFTNIDFMRYMLDLPDNTYSSISIQLKNGHSIEKMQESIQKLLGKNYIVKTRYEQNQSLFSVMQIEKWVIYIILSLILVIAAFNMIGALSMLVLEKQKDIAILKALGAEARTIQRIFLSEGFLLAFIGGGLGMLLAFIICVIQITLKPLKLSGGSFLVDYYPVKMHFSDFLLVGITVLIIALAASWIPAKKASKQFFSLKS